MTNGTPKARGHSRKWYELNFPSMFPTKKLYMDTNGDPITEEEAHAKEAEGLLANNGD